MAITEYNLGPVIGPQGPTGPKGADGTKITIGENGNWYRDGVDTGILANVDKAIQNRVVNNYTTNVSGYALDARAGKDLNDRLTQLNSDLSYSNVTEDSANGSSFGKDFMKISPGDRKSGHHKTACFFKQANDATWINVPEQIQVSDNFIGIRHVFYQASDHIMVKIEEMLPVAGRIWTNFYNYNGWSGWSRVDTTPQYITFGGNIAPDENTNKVFPCTGIAVKYPASQRMDLHFGFVIETNNSPSPTDFNVADIAKLRGWVNVTKLSWDAAYNSRVLIESPVYASGFPGRAGYKIVDSGGIGRCYQEDLSIVGNYPLSTTELFAVKNCIHVDIWGAVWS